MTGEKILGVVSNITRGQARKVTTLISMISI